VYSGKLTFFSAGCNIYISRLCYDGSVRLSVRLSLTEVHWRIIANLSFKFRSHFTAHCLAGVVLLVVLLAGRSTRAMLASARLSCNNVLSLHVTGLKRCGNYILQTCLARHWCIMHRTLRLRTPYTKDSSSLGACRSLWHYATDTAQQRC